jgi:putative peptide zinc metalloprotease protein
VTRSLFSTRWYRVADLKPRLRPQVRVQRKRWRDQLWFVLTDEATGRHHRINDATYHFIGRCNGLRNVQQIWDAVLQMHSDAASTQDEIVDLLVSLNEAELIQFDRIPDVDSLFQRRDESRRRRLRNLVNPLAFRLPLGDPNALLARFDGLGKLLFRPITFWLWLLIIAAAALSAAGEWRELSAFGSARLHSPIYLGLLWLTFPVIKAFHEIGHGLAVRRWGGDVHEAGVALLVLMPAPYVDASAASGFLGRQQRALVSAAGIMVELVIAAFGLLLWSQLSGETARDIGFALLFIGSLSTLLFNGNPLLRFDGYYVLCDVLDLPNLAARSTAYWQHLLRRNVLNLPSEPPQIGRGEGKWLLAYAPLAQTYRLLITLTILFWLAGLWLFAAGLAAIYFAVTMVALPLWRGFTQSLAVATPGAEMARTRRRLLWLLALPALLIFVLPLPHSTVAPGIVWLPDKAQIRPEVDGFVSELPVKDGSQVHIGELIARLDNPELLVQREQLESRLLGLQAERYRLLLKDPEGAQNQAVVIEKTEAELVRAQAKLGDLEIRAKVDGRLVMPRQTDLPGHFVRNGETMAYVLADGLAVIRAAVPEKDIALVQQHTRSAEVRLPEMPGRTLAAIVQADTPAASRELPSAALGDHGGGTYLTDPSDEHGRRLQEAVFMLDLKLVDTELKHIGARAWVRFDHGYAPLATQLYRRLAQVFIRQFSGAPPIVEARPPAPQ